MGKFDDIASQKLTEMRTKEQLTKPVMKTKVLKKPIRNKLNKK
jgi:hypothetical protein